jgi:hypothetical protein
MTDTETKYKILIERLSNAKPNAGNPDLLTDEIMQAIRLQQKKSTPGLLVWIRPLMTAAALFLFGMFLYQQLETTDTFQDNTLTQYVKPSFLNKTNCSSDSTLNFSENKKLLNQYICYLRSNIAENETSKQFYQKYLPKNRSIITQ